MDTPIGIFDSGIGGLSVWKEISKTLPNESIVYLADNLNCPYGSKSTEEIIELSVKSVEFLLSRKCKLIVVACNTATAAAIKLLRQKYVIPFVGMEPAVKPASLLSKTKNVGILATEGTFKGNHFKETSNKFAKNVKLHLQIGNGLVEFIEKGDFNSKELNNLLEQYLKPMIKNNVDQIVLGCSHYPFLISNMKKIVRESINIIDPAPAVAKRTLFILNELNLGSSLNNKSFNEFYSTGETEIIQNILYNILSVKSKVKKI